MPCRLVHVSGDRETLRLTIAFELRYKDFKNKTVTTEDKMDKKLDILLTEKTVREYQEKKEKRLWAIVLKALQEHRILSPKELEAITQLEIF